MAAVGGFPGQDHRHELNVYLGGAIRWRVCRAMWDEMNGWMDQFAQTTWAVAKGLLDGSLTEEDITSYPIGEYPGQLSKDIAHQLWLPYLDEETVYGPGGWRLNVGDEDITVGIQALRAIPEADACLNDDPAAGVWQFYPETLAANGVMIGQVRDVMRGMSLRQAAKLLVDVAAVRH